MAARMRSNRIAAACVKSAPSEQWKRTSAMRQCDVERPRSKLDAEGRRSIRGLVEKAAEQVVELDAWREDRDRRCTRVEPLIYDFAIADSLKTAKFSTTCAAGAAPAPNFRERTESRSRSRDIADIRIFRVGPSVIPSRTRIARRRRNESGPKNIRR